MTSKRAKYNAITKELLYACTPSQLSNNSCQDNPDDAKKKIIKCKVNFKSKLYAHGRFVRYAT